ncbi:ERG2/sigma1 receptor-like protein [Lipomyces kononenkoae]|uniref:ERG2/sigma1 receptor-like protein n=1 Tax=Lipomyces kononenkoae TaxID=34357 RepID=A0ACC3T2C3_LIPKO
MNYFKLSIILGVVLSVYYYLDTYVLPTLYIFDTEVLHGIVKESIAVAPPENTTALFYEINSRLRDVYGDNITPYNTEDWMFNNAGNAMGSMFIHHASISEYLIFFGTAIGTEGHTGVHMANDYFYILKGEQWVHDLGDPDPIIYKPGDLHVLKRGSVQQYSMPTTCFALELAQGWIPAMLPFGFADTVFSTLDFGTFAKTVYFTAKRMTESMLRGKF